MRDESPARLVGRLWAEGIRRAWIGYDRAEGRYRASHPALAGLAEAVARSPDQARHEAIFLHCAESADTLIAAFVHSTVRGQAQGGLRRRAYETVGEWLDDGLRLSRAMTRKSALADLWWGGGKGLIADRPEIERDPAIRAALYREYGSFVTGLRGCYVTAEDVGTSPADMAQVFATTRFATCIPRECGGSGNPAAATAAGVLCAIRAALEWTGAGTLAGRRVAVQGAGHVGRELCLRLAREGARVVVSDVSAERRAAVGCDAIEVRAADDLFLSEPCDVLAPCALGAVLGPENIPRLRTRIVCGAANNPLADERRDAEALAGRGIVYVPDFVANRLGIVHCANEQYGSFEGDPAIERHLERDDPAGIHQTTLRVLERAEREGCSTSEAAARLADERASRPHPIWGHRGLRIIGSLLDPGLRR